jgi:hypothetical protein
VGRQRQRVGHRKRRPRRPLLGMLLHIDGSQHQWFQDERWYDLIVILDDATSEIYTLNSESLRYFGDLLGRIPAANRSNVGAVYLSAQHKEVRHADKKTARCRIRLVEQYPGTNRRNLVGTTFFRQ